MGNTWHGVVVPSPRTLERYGLTLADWKDILRRQGFVCPICKKLPQSGRLVIDHVHAYRFDAKPPEERKRWVRGLTCVGDNHWVLTKYGSADKWENAAAYQRAWEERFAESEEARDEDIG